MDKRQGLCFSVSLHMDLRQFRYFVAVAEELNFTRAAKRVFTAQPALSRQISLLEERIGAPLFDRSARQIKLTHVGKILLEEAKAAIKHTDQAILKAQRVAQGINGKLRVGFTGTSLYRMLSKLNYELAHHYPQLELEYVELCTTEQETALLNHEIHVGFLHPPLYTASLSYETIDREPFYLAVPSNHTLAAKQSVAVADLEGQPLILLPRDKGPHLHDTIVGACHEADFEPKVVSREMKTHNVLGLVASGLGLALLSRSIAANPYPGVVFIAFRCPALWLELAVAWKQDDVFPSLKPILQIAKRLTSVGQQG